MAIDTTSVNNKNGDMMSGLPDSHDNANSLITFGYVDGTFGKFNSLLTFTLPSLSGTITDVKLKITKGGSQGAGVQLTGMQAHSLTQPNWSESQVTWNKYDNSNSWITPGGDYSATIISTVSTPFPSVTSVPIQGVGTTNPLSLNWGDTVNLILLPVFSSIVDDNFVQFNGKSASINLRPYLEITYTPSGSSSSFFQLF